MPGSQISYISDTYYSLAHEIKALQFLNSFGEIFVADDSHGRPGCDFVLHEKYQIETASANPTEHGD